MDKQAIDLDRQLNLMMRRKVVEATAVGLGNLGKVIDLEPGMEVVVVGEEERRGMRLEERWYQELDIDRNHPSSPEEEGRQMQVGRRHQRKELPTLVLAVEEEGRPHMEIDLVHHR